MTYTPPGMRHWFSELVRDIAPDAMLMSYAHWDGLIDHKHLGSMNRVIDYLDFVSLNTAMQQALVPYLDLSRPIAEVNELVLREDFFDDLALTTDEHELEIFDSYDHTIAINPREAEQIRQHSKHTRVALIPVTMEPYHIANEFAGPALFAVGPNLFNIQGYFYFARKILPEIQRVAPSFSLDVTGSFYPHGSLPTVDGINFRGFVPDLADLYRTCSFVVCPVLGGTGQQIKIVEAMAYGVPVVATRASAWSSPIEHGSNGLIADTAIEFAEHVVRLWNDRGLSRRLGEAAQETVASRFSRSRLISELSVILQPSTPGAIV